MPFSPSLANLSAAILILAAPVVSAEGKEIIAPDDKGHTREKAPKTAPSSEELLKIIEKQEALINALRKRINELEHGKESSAFATPRK